ncbi:MAG: zinc metallopeptidase [Lachnospiraceae bacterium]
MFPYGYGFGWGYYFDPTMILLLIGVVICLAAQAKVQSAVNKYSNINTYRGMTGAEAALQILQSQGIYDVTVEPHRGGMTDAAYVPSKKVVYLSNPLYHSTSIAAIGIAAHECGHAIQHHTEYMPLKFMNLLPITNFAAQISWPLILIGVLFGGLGSPLVQIGILMFSITVLYQLLLLPVEFNASSRAVALLGDLGMATETEIDGTKKVLRAAAFTYVAAAASMVLQLLRLVILFGGRNDRE